MSVLGPRLLFISLAMAAQAGQTSQELFEKVRLNVARNLERMPKSICVQRQERRVFADPDHQRVADPAPVRSPGDPLSGGRTIPTIMSAPREEATFVVDPERLHEGRLISEWKTVERPFRQPVP